MGPWRGRRRTCRSGCASRRGSRLGSTSKTPTVRTMQAGDQSAPVNVGQAGAPADPILAVEERDPDPRTRRRVAEFLLLFLVAPALLANWMHRWMLFPAIWTLGAATLMVLLRDPEFERRRLWNARAVRACLRVMLYVFIAGATVLTGALLLLEPKRLLILPRTDARLWALIMVGYPVLSVYPQEVAFRAFSFHRYGALFRSRWTLLAASAAAFGYTHIVLHNWTAIGLSTVGGVLFGYTYMRTKSVLASSIEHALYGC